MPTLTIPCFLKITVAKTKDISRKYIDDCEINFSVGETFNKYFLTYNRYIIEIIISKVTISKLNIADFFASLIPQSFVLKVIILVANLTHIAIKIKTQVNLRYVYNVSHPL